VTAQQPAVKKFIVEFNAESATSSTR